VAAETPLNVQDVHHHQGHSTPHRKPNCIWLALPSVSRSVNIWPTPAPYVQPFSPAHPPVIHSRGHFSEHARERRQGSWLPLQGQADNGTNIPQRKEPVCSSPGCCECRQACVVFVHFYSANPLQEGMPSLNGHSSCTYSWKILLFSLKILLFLTFAARSLNVRIVLRNSHILSNSRFFCV